MAEYSLETDALVKVSEAVGKSSTDQTPDTADFKGTIDGGGFKGVMIHPKLPLELIPPQVLEALALVLQHGAKKYAKNNWLRGMSWTMVYGSILRHLFDWFRGKELDDGPGGSGLPHLWHALCEVIFLVYYTYGDKYKALDDRVFKDGE